MTLTVRESIPVLLEQDGPLSRAELAAALGVHVSGVKRAVRELIAAGLVHVGEWRRATGGRVRHPTELLAPGPGAVPRYQPLTNAQTRRVYEDKRRRRRAAERYQHPAGRAFALLAQQLGVRN